MNQKTRKYIVKQLPLDFYIKFIAELHAVFPLLEWREIYYVKSTGGWAHALQRACSSQYEWFWHIWNKAKWYDSDLLDALIGTRLYNLCRKGKVSW